MYIDLIDFPNVPDELLESPADIISKTSVTITTYKSGTSIQRKNISKELTDWLQSVGKFTGEAQYLILNYCSPIHRDPPKRIQSYNYIICTGGPTVSTNVYDDDQNVLKSLVIPEKTWYCLDTGRLHSVRGILPNIWRVLLTVNAPIPLS